MTAAVIPCHHDIGILGSNVAQRGTLNTLCKQIGFVNIIEFDRGGEALQFMKEDSLAFLFVFGELKDVHWLTFVRQMQSDVRIHAAPTMIFLNQGEKLEHDWKTVLQQLKISTPRYWPVSEKDLLDIIQPGFPSQNTEESVNEQFEKAKEQFSQGIKTAVYLLYAAAGKQKFEPIKTKNGAINPFEEEQKQLNVLLTTGPEIYSIRFQQMNALKRNSDLQRLKERTQSMLDLESKSTDDFWLTELADISISYEFYNCAVLLALMLEVRATKDLAWYVSFIRSRLALAQGKTDDALRLAIRAQEASKSPRPEILNLFGVIERRKMRHQEALHFLEQAVRMDPSDARILYNLAITYLDIGRENDARQTLGKALLVYPGHPKSLSLQNRINEKATRPGT